MVRSAADLQPPAAWSGGDASVPSRAPWASHAERLRFPFAERIQANESSRGASAFQGARSALRTRSICGARSRGLEIDQLNGATILTMALGALAEDDGRNVLGEGHLTGGRPRHKQERGKNKSYLLVHQSVTAEVSPALEVCAMTNERRKLAVFCHIPLLSWRFPQYTGKTFYDGFLRLHHTS